MLRIEQLDAFYGSVQVLRGLQLALDGGEVLCLLGRNGAGKTSTLRAIMGLIEDRRGSIMFNGEELGDLPAHEIPKRGIGYVPQGRRLFAELTVRENLEIGLMARASKPAVLDGILDQFPMLGERLYQRSGTLSGGEQQMLAIARALCLEPSLMLLDEPTEGLMPSMIEAIRTIVRRLSEQGVGVLLVEQRVDAVLPVADRVAFAENGRIRQVLPVGDLKDDPHLLHKYVGVGTVD